MEESLLPVVELRSGSTVSIRVSLLMSSYIINSLSFPAVPSEASEAEAEHSMEAAAFVHQVLLHLNWDSVDSYVSLLKAPLILTFRHI